MAVNKNFVVKNGLEVNTDLIVADIDSSKVGVGTTISSYLLHVYQGTGIGASSVYVTGISTVAQEFNVGLGGSIFTVLGNAEGTAGIGQSVGVGTGEPAYLLDVRAPVSTGQTALYVQGDMRVTGDLNLDDLTLSKLKVTGIATFNGDTNFDYVGGGATVGFGSTAYFTDQAKAVFGHGEDLEIYHDRNNSIINDNGTGNLQLQTGGSTKLEILGAGVTITGGVSVSGFSTFSDTVQIESLTDNRVAIVGAGSTIEDDGNLTFDGGQLEVGVGLSVAGLSTFVGVGTFISDLYVGGDLYIKENITLDTNLNILGIATIGALDITNYADFGLGIDVAGYGVTSTTLNVTGVSTLGGTVDINNSVEVSGITTIQNTTDSDSKDTGALVVEGGVGIEKNLKVGAGLSVVGFSTFSDTVQIESLTDNRVAIVGAGSTIEDDGNLTFDGGQLEVGVGLSVAGLSTFVGVGTFISDLYVGGDLFISENITLDTNLNILGIATIGTLDVTNYADFGLGIDVAGYGVTSTTLNVTGVSTFGGTVDINNSVEIAGITTLQDTTQSSSKDTGALVVEGGVGIEKNLFVGGGAEVTGILTVTNDADFNGSIDVDGHTELDDLNVSGVSTFVGFSTFNDFVFIQDGLNVAGPSTSNSYTINGTQVISSGRELQNIASLDATTTSTIESAIANAPNTFTDLRVSGVSTFIGLSTFAGGAEFQGVGATSTTLTVSGVSTFSGNVDINAQVDISTDILVGGAATVTGTTDLNGDLDVDGHTELDNVNVAGFSTFASNVDINAQVDISTDILVGGAATVTGATDLNGALDVDGHTELDDVNIAGFSTFASNVDINAQVDISTDILVGGAATVTGAADFNGDIDVDGHTELDNVNVSGVSTFTSNIFVGTAATVGFGSTAFFKDNAKAIFGDGDDLQIYHDGSHSYIEDAGTGALILKASFVRLQTITGENMLTAANNGAVQLMYDNGTKLETTSTGATVTGNLSADGIRLGDNDIIYIGDGNDLAINHDGSNSFITDQGTGSLYIQGTTGVYIRKADGSEVMAGFTGDGAVELYHDDSKKFETTGAGVTVTGICSASGGFDIGIHSGGTSVATGPIKILNFIGTGNTFAYTAGTDTIDISIAGGSGGGGITTTHQEVQSTSATGISTFSTTAFRSAHMIVGITQGTSYQTGRYLIIHDDTTPTILEESALATGDMIATFDATIAGGNLTVRVNMSNSGLATVAVKMDTINSDSSS